MADNRRIVVVYPQVKRPGFESNRRQRNGVRLRAESASAHNPQPSASSQHTNVKKASSGLPRQVLRRTGWCSRWNSIAGRTNLDFTHPLDREMFYVSGNVLI